MALDGAFLLAVKQELTPLIGGRAEKIHQPSKDELIITIRTRDGSSRLLMSAAAGSARLHITEEAIENPPSPPMFCMLMRKHLSGARLADIRQDGLERILYFVFEGINELGDPVTLTLAAEIMGKYSNIILIGSEGRIIDSIKRTDDVTCRDRIILPGAQYTPPKRDERLNFLTADREEIRSRISTLTGRELSRGLVRIFEGVSPVLCDEWVYRAYGGDISPEEVTSADRLIDEIFRTRDEFFGGRRQFTIIREQDGRYKDFCFTNITKFGSLMKTEGCKSACETLERFYSERDRTARMKQRYHDLYKLLENAYERVLRRTENQKRELEESRKKDIYKLKGDLISANLYALEKGMTRFTCTNFYSEGEEITIELDPRFTPSQNMQRYYGLYRKADNAEKRLHELIAAGENELLYIDSVRDALSRAETENDVNALRSELMEQGYIRSTGGKGRQKSPKASPPIELFSPDGYRVLVGRNNRQNDELTLKTADKTDIWLHVKDITGSHVIIRTEGTTPPDTTILFAAAAAAANSRARNSSQVPVDYTLVKNVKKPSGAKPGMVIFTGNRTVYVKPLNSAEIKHTP